MTAESQTAQDHVFRPKRPLVIGLLGGIASGKSTVARIFEKHGLTLLDADREAHRVTRQPAVQRQLAARFGAGILRANGSLDRRRLADLVFADRAARADLEGIVHPRVRAALLVGLDAARAQGRSVLLDVPLLLENGLIDRCDICVFVDSAAATRRTRATDRGWDPDEIRRREANQASLPVKKSRCAYTILNDGSLEETDGQVKALLRQLESP